MGKESMGKKSKSSESTVNALEVEAAAAAAAKRRRVTRIGKPGYNVTKTRDVKTKRRTLTFELHYPEIAGGQRPRHRFLSAFEQTIDTPADRNFQYLVFACDPYESVAFKVPNEPIDSDSVYSTYEDGGKKATLQFSFL
jgi:splicing factor 3A subunit 2